MTHSIGTSLTADVQVNAKLRSLGTGIATYRSQDVVSGGLQMSLG
jgi:hypothetical protein